MELAGEFAWPFVHVAHARFIQTHVVCQRCIMELCYIFSEGSHV